MSKVKIFICGMRKGMDPTLAFGSGRRMELYYEHRSASAALGDAWSAAGSYLWAALRERERDLRAH